MKQHFSLLDGKISGVRFGQGSHRLLAFHGFLDHALSFQRLSENLDDVEIWAIDLPGHGFSDSFPSGRGTFLLNWFPLLGDILDDLNWSEYQILGHSLGAILSQMLAAVDSRVVSVYSMDALGPMSSARDESFKRFRRVYQHRQRKFSTKFYSTHEALVQSRRQGMFPLSESAAVLMANRGVGMSERGWFHRYDRKLRDDSLWRLDEPDVLYWLGQISCPVYLVVFQTEQFARLNSLVRPRQQAIKSLQVTELSGSHHEHIEQPSRVADWLRDCLSSAAI